MIAEDLWVKGRAEGGDHRAGTESLRLFYPGVLCHHFKNLSLKKKIKLVD